VLAYEECVAEAKKNNWKLALNFRYLQRLVKGIEKSSEALAALQAQQKEKGASMPGEIRTREEKVSSYNDSAFPLFAVPKAQERNGVGVDPPNRNNPTGQGVG
jgi:hypothetical protein